MRDLRVQVRKARLRTRLLPRLPTRGRNPMNCVQTWLSRGSGRTEPSPPSYLHPSLGGWFKALKSNYSASRVGANRPPQDSRHAESSIADGSPLPLGRSAVPLLATKSTDNEGPPTMASEPLWTAFLVAHSGSGDGAKQAIQQHKSEWNVNPIHGVWESDGRML